MSTFVNAVKHQANQTFTENGMPAMHSSLNKCVDLFFNIGASRGKDVTALYGQALAENRELALRLLLWVRDAREGSGERQTFRNLLQYLEAHDEAALIHVLPRVVELGRWDDLLVFKSTPWKQVAFSMIKEGLANQDGLCAKWMPRKGKEAAELRSFLGLTPKQYRKTLVSLSNTVEQAMCSKDWSKIVFEHVPSVAAARYQKAFTRNCGQRYADYRQALSNGTTTIKASTLYPYDVIRSLRNGDRVVSEAQWEALPDYMPEGTKIVPLIDVSGSMMTPVAGSVSALEAAVSLGLYTATKQKGAFANIALTFSAEPEIQHLTGSLKNKHDKVMSGNWGMNTDLSKAFDKILSVATKANVVPEDMPSHLLILSDMQFDQCVTNASDNAFQMIQRKYEKHGYRVPNVIFWNLNARGSNVPVTYKQNGTALVSGFSPSLMMSILGAKTVTPESVMLETILKDRYNLA